MSDFAGYRVSDYILGHDEFLFMVCNTFILFW